MRRLNPEHFDRLIPRLNQAPFLRLLNMEVRELGWSHALVELELSPELLNPLGGVHGGAYTSLVDTAAFWSAYCQTAPDTIFVTVDVGVSMMGAAREGRLTARGECLTLGRTLGLTQATVTDNKGRIIAHGNSKLVAIPGKNTISQLVESMCGGSLPPKFLD